MRRTEDKIRDLCRQIVAAKDDKDATKLLGQLREALRQYTEQIRTRLSGYPFVIERRDQSRGPLLDTPLKNTAKLRTWTASTRNEEARRKVGCVDPVGRV